MNVYELSVLIAAIPTGLTALIYAVKLGKEVARPNSRNANGSLIAVQFETLRRDLIAEIRREREGLSKEIEDAITRLALELTRELRDRRS